MVRVDCEYIKKQKYTVIAEQRRKYTRKLTGEKCISVT